MRRGIPLIALMTLVMALLATPVVQATAVSKVEASGQSSSYRNINLTWELAGPAGRVMVSISCSANLPSQTPAMPPFILLFSPDLQLLWHNLFSASGTMIVRVARVMVIGGRGSPGAIRTFAPLPRRLGCWCCGSLSGRS